MLNTLAHIYPIHKGLQLAELNATLSDACVHMGPLVYGPEYLRKNAA